MFKVSRLKFKVRRDQRMGVSFNHITSQKLQLLGKDKRKTLNLKHETQIQLQSRSCERFSFHSGVGTK
jgi:hypothetical protein